MPRWLAWLLPERSVETESTRLFEILGRNTGWTFAKNWMAIEDFTGSDLLDLRDKSVAAYRQGDPLAVQVINWHVALTLGGPVSISIEDDKAQVLWDRFAQLNDFESRLIKIVHNVYLQGEAFVRFFDDSSNGNPPRITLPSPKLVTEIETDPEDFESIQNFVLEINGEEKRVPATEMQQIKRDPLGTSRRGWPLLAPVLKDMKRYDQYLFTRLLLNLIRASIPMIRKIKGAGKEAIEAAVQAFGTKMPKPGSMLTVSDNEDWSFPQLNIDAGDTKEDGDRFLARVAHGTGLTPDFLLDKPADLTSNSPTVKYFDNLRMMIFRPAIRKIVERVVGPGQTIEIGFEPISKANMQSDAQGIGIALNQRFESPQGAAARIGRDWKQVMQEWQDALKEFDRVGIQYVASGAKTNPVPIQRVTPPPQS